MFHIFPYSILVLLVCHLLFFQCHFFSALFLPCFLLVIHFHMVSLTCVSTLSSFESQALQKCCNFTKGVHINFCLLSISIFFFVQSACIIPSAKDVSFLCWSRCKIDSAVPCFVLKFSSTIFDMIVWASAFTTVSFPGIRFYGTRPNQEVPCCNAFHSPGTSFWRFQYSAIITLKNNGVKDETVTGIDVITQHPQYDSADRPHARAYFHFPLSAYHARARRQPVKYGAPFPRL